MMPLLRRLALLLGLLAPLALSRTAHAYPQFVFKGMGRVPLGTQQGVLWPKRGV